MTVSKQIIQVLDALGEKICITIDWASENVVPMAQQICERYIRYEIVMSILWMVLELGVIAGLIFGGTKLFKFFIEAKQKPSYGRNLCIWVDVAMIFTSIGIGVLGILSITDIIINIETLCKCLLLPELHLFEKFSGLLK